MPAIPVSFVLSLFFVLFLFRLTWTRDGRSGWLLRVTLAVYALQSLLLGLRWGYAVSPGWAIQLGVAVMIPALTYLTLNHHVSSRAARMGAGEALLHGTPAVLVAGAALFWKPAVDILVAAVFLAYGCVLFYRTVRDLEWLDRVPFQVVVSANGAFMAAGAVLVVSALVDLAVAYDIVANSGARSAEIVGISNVALLVVLSSAIVLVGRITPPVDPSEDPESTIAPPIQPLAAAAAPDAPPPDMGELRAQHLEILRRLDEQMAARHLYRAPNLSLDRLARKLVVPARQISSAINSQRAMNVSQYVNTFRIAEACKLLKSTDAPISQIIFDVGFQTKSNFNREFLRVMGMSPSEWRQTGAPEPAAPAAPAGAPCPALGAGDVRRGSAAAAPSIVTGRRDRAS